MADLAKILAEQLESDGIDPEYFLEHGVKAAQQAAGGDETGRERCLHRLKEFTAMLLQVSLTPTWARTTYSPMAAVSSPAMSPASCAIWSSRSPSTRTRARFSVPE